MKGKKLIEWRRNQIVEYSSKGYNQADIAKILQVGEATISRDFAFLREQAKKNIQDYVDNLLPLEYRKCLNGLDNILKKAWSISNQDNLSSKEQVQALTLAQQCYTQKMELLTNTAVINDSIKFVSNRKEKLLQQEQEQQEDNNDNNDIDDDNSSNSNDEVATTTTE